MSQLWSIWNGLGTLQKGAICCLSLTNQMSGNSCYNFCSSTYCFLMGLYNTSEPHTLIHACTYDVIHSYLHTHTFTCSSLEVKPGQLPPPGLNRTLVTKVIGGTTPSPEQLEQRKIAIVKLLSSEVLLAEEVVCQLIAAAGDAKSR